MCHVLSRSSRHVTSRYVMLQAIMMFSVCGSRTEMMGDRHNAYSMYIETLSLIKFLTKLTNSSRNNNQDVDPRYRIADKNFLIDIDISELIIIMFVVHKTWDSVHVLYFQTGCSVSAGSVITKFKTLQDEEARAEGLSEDHPGRAGQERGGPLHLLRGPEQD